MNSAKVNQKNENCKKFEVKIAPEYEYSLSWHNAKTLSLFYKLQDKQSKLPCKEYGIFFAFSKKQFEEGMKECGYTEADKPYLLHMSGGYGKEESWTKYMDAIDAISAEIKEKCDPFEVFCEQYNNYECCLSCCVKQEVKDYIETIWDEKTFNECMKKFDQVNDEEYVSF